MKIRKIMAGVFLSAFLALLLCFTNYSYAVVSDEPIVNDQAPQYVPGEVLVKFKEGIDPSSILKEAGIEAGEINRVHSIKPAVSKFRKDYKIEKDPAGGWYSFLGKQYKEVEDIPDEEMFEEAYSQMPETEKSLYRSYKVVLPEGITVEEAISKLKNNPDVEYAEPNGIVKVLMVPNDPYYSTSGSWGQPYDDLWGIKRIQCENAWDISQGDGVVVAVIDTGVDYNHPDLAANIWRNQNGRCGYNFVHDNDFPLDDNGHGTHVAGTIAAVGNNGTGVIGVAPHVRIMAIKGLNRDGEGKISDLAECVTYAADNGADVLNNSWGGQGISQTLIDAFNDAYNKGCVSVAAAGNDGDDVLKSNPANIHTVIAVAAFNQNDEYCGFSNYGVKIDVAAPGGDSQSDDGNNKLNRNILSLRANNTDIYDDELSVVNNTYYRSRGTSMACPHVAGLAALIKSRHPEFSVDEVRQVIMASADDVGTSGWDIYSGYGRINCLRALQTNSVCTARISSPQYGSTQGNLIEIRGSAYGAGFNHYVIEYAVKSDIGIIWLPITGARTSPVINGKLGEFDTLLLEEASGEIYLRLTVFDNSNHIFCDISVIKVKNLEINNIPIGEIYRSGDVINIAGTVSSRNLSNYIVEYKKMLEPDSGWRSNGITLAGGGTTPVQNGLLAAWNTTGLEEERYVLRLRAYRTTGSSHTLTGKYPIIVSPLIKENWPARIEFNIDPASNDKDSSYVVDDLDGDGLKEIIVTVSGKPSRIFIFRHDGSMALPRPIEISSSNPNTDTFSFASPPICGDLDLDGRDEILVIMRGISSGEITKPHITEKQIYAYNDDGTPLAGWNLNIPDIPYNNYNIGTWMAIADLDRDGRPEVVISGSTGMALYILDNRGNIITEVNRGMVRNALFSFSYYPVLSIGNLDDDADLEVLLYAGGATDGSGVTHYYLYAFDMDGAIVPGWPAEVPWNLPFPILTDIDSDGREEVIFPTIEDGLYVLDDNGSIFPGWPQKRNAQDQFFTQAVVSDWDNNGDLEIVIKPYFGGPYIFNHDGTPFVPRPELAGMSVTTTPLLADMTSDNIPDVIGSSRSGPYSNMGCIDGATAGARIPRTPQFTPMCTSPLPDSDPVISDIDNDGYLEIVALGKFDNFINNSYYPDIDYSVHNHLDVIVWDTGYRVNRQKMDWTMARHDPQNTGRYTPPNDPPVLTPIGLRTVNEGALLTFTVSANDPNAGYLLAYRAVNLPPGATFNPAARTFSWTPGYTQSGNYNATFIVMDRWQATDMETIAITVNNTNRPPDVANIPSALIMNGGDIITRAQIELATDPDGNTFTYTYSGWITFLPYTVGYDQGGPHTLYVDVSDGTATVRKNIIITVNRIPSTGTVVLSNNKPAPNLPIVFTTTYIDGDGWQDIKDAFLLVNTPPTNPQDGARYNLLENKLYLRSADNTAWLGGYAPGSNNHIDNGLFVLNCLTTTVSGSGSILTIRWAGYFKPAYAGQKSMYLKVTDKNGAGGAVWDPKGTITIMNYAPQVGSMTPSIPSGSYYPGQEVTFSTSCLDPNGADDIRAIAAIWQDYTAGQPWWMAVVYDQLENNLYMLNDTGTAWIGGYTPGSNNIIKNSYMELDCRTTTVSKSGNTVRVNFKLKLYSTMQGTKNLYINVSDRALVYSGWGYNGTWTIRPDTIPQAGTVTPSSGSFTLLNTYTFSAVYNDNYWANDISLVAMSIWSTPPLAGRYGGVYYDAVNDLLYISSDDGTRLLGGVRRGTNTTISNSYAILDCANTTVARQGSILTVNWKIRFKLPIRGLRNIYSNVKCRGGATSGWQSRGTIRIN